MRFQCDRCGKRYVTGQEIREGRVYSLRCSACGHRMIIRGGQEQRTPTPVPLPGRAGDAPANGARRADGAGAEPPAGATATGLERAVTRVQRIAEGEGKSTSDSGSIVVHPWDQPPPAGGYVDLVLDDDGAPVDDVIAEAVMLPSPTPPSVPLSSSSLPAPGAPAQRLRGPSPGEGPSPAGDLPSPVRRPTPPSVPAARADDLVFEPTPPAMPLPPAPAARAPLAERDPFLPAPPATDELSLPPPQAPAEVPPARSTLSFGAPPADEDTSSGRRRLLIVGGAALVAVAVIAFVVVQLTGGEPAAPGRGPSTTVATARRDPPPTAVPAAPAPAPSADADADVIATAPVARPAARPEPAPAAPARAPAPAPARRPAASAASAPYVPPPPPPPPVRSSPTERASAAPAASVAAAAPLPALEPAAAPAAPVASLAPAAPAAAPAAHAASLPPPLPPPVVAAPAPATSEAGQDEITRVRLRADVEGLGRSGEVVDVPPGYARRLLFPKGLAVPAAGGRAKVAAPASAPARRPEPGAPAERRAEPAAQRSDEPISPGPGTRSPVQATPDCVERAIVLAADVAARAPPSVTLRFAVGRDGVASRLGVWPGPGSPPGARLEPGMVQAFASAIRGCRFTPGADEQGVPTSMWMVMQVRVR